MYLQQQVDGRSSVPRAQTQRDGWQRLDKHPADRAKWKDYQSLLQQWQATGPSATLCAWVREQLLARIDDVLADPTNAIRFRAFETLTQQARTLVLQWKTNTNRVAASSTSTTPR